MAILTLDLKPLLGWLDDEDDPDLWVAVLTHVLSDEWLPRPQDILEIGRCSHWLRPIKLDGKPMGASLGRRAMLMGLGFLVGELPNSIGFHVGHGTERVGHLPRRFER